MRTEEVLVVSRINVSFISGNLTFGFSSRLKKSVSTFPLPAVGEGQGEGALAIYGESTACPLASCALLSPPPLRAHAPQPLGPRAASLPGAPAGGPLVLVSRTAPRRRALPSQPAAGGERTPGAAVSSCSVEGHTVLWKCFCNSSTPSARGGRRVSPLFPGRPEIHPHQVLRLRTRQLTIIHHNRR